MSNTRILLLGAVFALAFPTSGSAQTVSVSARASAAILVPTAAIELRAAGVPAPEVRTAIVEVRTARIPAPEVHLVLVRSRSVVEVYGPIPDYGAFIGVKIRGGFRGPRLFNVIEVEHQHRGHPGRGFMKGHYRDHRGPPGQVRMGGMGNVVIHGGHPMGGVRIRGGHPMGGRVRVRGPGPGPRVHVMGGGGMARIGGGGGGMARIGGGGRGGAMGGGGGGRMGGGRMR